MIFNREQWWWRGQRNALAEYLFYVLFLPCTYTQQVDSWCLRMLKEGIRLSGTGVIGSCEPLSLCWELNPGLLQGQQVLF